MSLEVIIEGRDRYVLVPCAAPARESSCFRTIRLGAAADPGHARARLDRWFRPVPSRSA
jgi:hypothetical protein